MGDQDTLEERGGEASGWSMPLVSGPLPHPHRVYDYMLGGKDHYLIDARAAEEYLTVAPDSIYTARAMEGFIPRAVTRLAQQGITQFLQLGVAIVSPYNGQAVSDHVARTHQPTARFLYVAEDPVSVARARALLVGRGPYEIAVHTGDFREPGALIARPEISGFFDHSRPIGILLICMLNFIADPEQAARAVEDLYSWAPDGSRIAFFHVMTQPEVDWSKLSAPVIDGCNSVQLTMRTPQELRDVLGDCYDRLEEPGLVWAPEWHPDGTGPNPEDGERAAVLAGMIAKPGPADEAAAEPE